MKVLNYTTSYFAIVLLLLISIWAVVFYYSMLDEIYDSIDDGLDNQKGLILQKVAIDSNILKKSNFDESDYAITGISPSAANSFHDVYMDTMMYMQNEKDYEPVRLLKSVFQSGGKYYLVQVATSMVEEDDLVAELLYAMIWLYLGLIATILIINNLLLKKIWSPFNHLVRQIKNFKLEKPSFVETKKTTIDEFQLLNDTVSELLQKNIVAYNSQKHFVENAAHELQTPLGIIINKLETLAETKGLSTEQLALLASAMQNLERLTRLNRSLLLLFKIENKLFHEKEAVNLNELAKNILQDFADQLAYSNLKADLREESKLVVTMNPGLASIMLTNLVKNAMIHSAEGGSVVLEIGSKKLIVSNPGDKALIQEELFQRFTHRHGAESSTGLGLAIVKAIADLYGIKITYVFNGSHQFILSFI
jgi:signal transduction histidine kinase